MSRPLLSDPPKIVLKPGTEEHSKFFAEKLQENLLDKMKKEREMKDEQGMNWSLDREGIADWNKW